MQGASARFAICLCGLLLLFCRPGFLQAQSVKNSACAADAMHPGWRVYTNDEFHFCLRYPSTYHEVPAPPPDEFSSTRRFLGGLELNQLPPGTHGSPVNNKAGIGFVIIPKAFSMKQLQLCCAPTGLDDTPPAPVNIGGRVFFFYGPGGGGVDYADDYFLEINGKILDIQFGGPWKDSKSPIEEMKSVQMEVLSTFRTY